MKNQYVKTSNWAVFETALQAVSDSGSEEARIMLLTSEPGCGKTATVDRYGSEVNAIYLQGMPGMTTTFTTDYLADRLGVRESRSYQKFNGILDKLAANRTPIILDEAQHAAEGKAKPLEYLRRVSEQAGVMLILVCHTREKNLFTEHKMAHINTRITAKPEFKPADLADATLYMRELCEVNFDDEVVNRALEQSRGRYRILNNAIKTIERLAKVKQVDFVTGDMVSKLRLCEDVGKAL
jgi:DNA transposition AAA+ family ATPase